MRWPRPAWIRFSNSNPTSIPAAPIELPECYCFKTLNCSGVPRFLVHSQETPSTGLRREDNVAQKMSLRVALPPPARSNSTIRTPTAGPVEGEVTHVRRLAGCVAVDAGHHDRR